MPIRSYVFALRVIGFLLIAATGTATASAGQKPDQVTLTHEERAWIAQHPVVRVDVLRDLQPLEYMEDGQIRGLSTEYLAHISRKTGLTFSYTPYEKTGKDRVDDLINGKLDMLSGIRANGPQGNDPRMRHTSVYLNTTTVVVTRKRQRPIAGIGGLDGMVVTLPCLGLFGDMIFAKAPNAQLITGDTPLAMLRQVASGEADAAVATEAFLGPFLYRDFQDQLQISGVLTELTSEMAMAVDVHQPVLHAILQKGLDSMTPDEVRAVHANWIKRPAPLDPPLTEITDHYPCEVALAALALVLLAATACQMHRMRQRAEGKKREIAIFLAVMSHEIRSLMNAVLAAIELLRNTPMDKQQYHLAHLANTGSDTLLALVNDLLDVSKLEANQGSVEREPVNIAALVRDTVDLHILRAREKRISLTFEGDMNPPLLMLDGIRVGQILRNLISNAIRFTDTGGVQIQFSIADMDTPGTKHLHVVVTDTGVGITEESQKSLFQPYSQASSACKRPGGTGLGMFICRELLKLMHGTISLSSKVGKGTRIEVSLPADVANGANGSAATPGGQDPATPRPGKPANNLQILIVEDAPINQVLLRQQLEGFGCTPVFASDAAQAVARFEQSSYDLVLMDCGLPDRDGYAMTALFRAMEQDAGQARCPIIAISGFTHSKHVERCFDAGMDGVLSKPICLGKLQDAIELWCGVTLTLVPQPLADKSTLDNAQIIETLAQDLHALLEAMALNDAQAARHATHRLHGAALSTGWSAIALAAKRVEDLLHAPASRDAAACANALQALVHDFRTTRFPDPVRSLERG